MIIRFVMTIFSFCAIAWVVFPVVSWYQVSGLSLSWSVCRHPFSLRRRASLFFAILFFLLHPEVSLIRLLLTLSRRLMSVMAQRVLIPVVRMINFVLDVSALVSAAQVRIGLMHPFVSALTRCNFCFRCLRVHFLPGVQIVNGDYA